MKIIVVGGGYAGLATLISLRKNLPEAELHLVDPKTHHVKLTQLHKTLHHPLEQYRESFAQLGQRYRFTHYRSAVHLTEKDLPTWQYTKTVTLLDGDLDFDALVIATGARPRKLPKASHVYDQDDFGELEGREIMQGFLHRTQGGKRCISIVGGGATGLQFLFELHYWLQLHGIRCELRLINRSERLLPNLPGSFHAYVSKRLRRIGVEYLPQIGYQGQNGEVIGLEDLQTGQSYNLPSGLTLLFPGVTPYPYPLSTNRYGQVMIGERTLRDIFAAGDCSRFNSWGLNALTAQAAVRKGKQIATNIRRIHQRRLPYIYSYAELGYFISLGPLDGIGWLLFKHNIITGVRAFAIQTAVKKQYDLFVDGIDVYV